MLNNMKGQTLIEVLVALTVAVIIVSAVTAISISSLSNAQFVRDQDQALKYAQEGVELVRGVRNSDYGGFKLNYDGWYCLGDDHSLVSSVASCDTLNVVGKYIRSVRIRQGICNNDINNNLAEVTVNVSYTSGKCKSGSSCHSSNLVSCFSTANPIPAP